MSYLEAIYLGSTLITVGAGLILVGMGLRAYAATRRVQMIHLSIGFGLIVLAMIGTAAVGFATGFGHPRQLLVLNSGLSTFGYVFVLYSLVTY